MILTDDIDDPPVPPGTIEVPDRGTDTPQNKVVPEGTLEPSNGRVVQCAGEVTPPTVLAAAAQLAVGGAPDQTLSMANGLAQYMTAKLETLLQETAIKMARDAETLMVEMANYTKGVLASNEHAAYQLSDALLKVQERGLPLLSPPYSVVVHAVTPNGLPLTLTIHKPTSEELVEEMQRLTAWLETNGYTPFDFPGVKVA